MYYINALIFLSRPPLTTHNGTSYSYLYFCYTLLSRKLLSRKFVIVVIFAYSLSFIIYFHVTLAIINWANIEFIGMQAEQLQPLPKGNYYMIICKAHDKSVCVEESNYKNHKKSKLISSNTNPQDNNQIFMIERLDTYGTKYEIVCCASDYVFEEHNHHIVLANGNQSKHQLFSLMQAPSTKLHQYYIIRSTHNPNMAMALEGQLRMVTFDANSITQHFRFEEVNNATLQNSCLLINNYCGKAIDVPEGSEKQGERIGIWERNKRWNQRWIFQKIGSMHAIKNVMSGLYLDIAGESRENGAKIIQWAQTGNTNQIWMIQQAGDKLYKIWSYHEPSLCLGLRKQEGADGTPLEVTRNDNPTTYWRIQGSLPK